MMKESSRFTQYSALSTEEGLRKQSPLWGGGQAMSEQTMRFRMGIFVLATMVLLAVLITLFGSAPTLFTRFNRYTVVFSDAPGVAQGTPVRRSGVRIGQVEKFYLDSETGRVR